MNETKTKYYYVDESGDGILFNRKGEILIDKPDSMKHFLLGALDVENPFLLKTDFDKLRNDILNDPYFSKVPSIKPEQRKTAIQFHAKDDIPEVRREVFKILLKHNLKFYAVLKRMKNVLSYVQNRNQRDPNYRYRPNELYDFTVRVLFKNLLHKDDEINICFSKRGKSDRSNSLMKQIIKAKERFCNQWHKKSDSEIKIIPKYSYEEAGLQATDYFLWALQRLYECGEERYISYIWDKVSLIIDQDDIRKNRYGEYYTKKKPLTLAAIKEISEI